MSRKSSIGAALVALTLTTLATTAAAQRPQQQVLDLNRQGMEHYNNLEIDQAEQKLNRALQIAQRRGVEGPPLARTHLNLGVVAVGGMGDNAAGMQHFEAALRADSSIQLDPLTSTPEIQTVFNLARSRVGDGGGGGGTDGGGGGGGGASGNIPHMPVPEQLAQTAVPVFVDVPDDAPVDSLYLYYKGLGMRDFRRVEMQRIGGGYGFEIPCADVFQPKVEYYIVAFGEDGSPLGFSGTAEEPIEVPIVGTRTMPPPALPGASPPQQCSETECPPGMEGCSGGGGGGGMGDTCLSDAECRDGLSCQDEFCVADDDGGGGGGEPGDFWGWYEDAPTLFLQLGFGLGLSVVSAGMYSDGEPDMGVPGSNEVYIPEGTGDCVDNVDGFQDYCVRVETGGLVGTYAFRAMIGGFVQPWLGLAVSLRIQPNSGSGTLAGMLIGGRAILRPFGDLLPYADLRFHVGTMVGQVQPQPPQNGAPEPYIRSGLNGIDFGVSNVFNIMKYFGLYLEADFQILFPISLFNIDVNAGLQVGF